MISVSEYEPLAPLTTFGIGGPARYFATATTPQQVAEAVAWARDRALPLFVLGGGSNLLVRDSGFPGLVLNVLVPGVGPLGDGLFAVGAGEPWDAFVQQAVDADCAGIECLAGVPGLTGGTPVQNVGAYGQEVAETVVAVHAYDRVAKAFLALTNDECRFRYRASRFNTDEPNRYIVHRVDFKLAAGAPPTLHYADLQRHFAGQSPSLPAVAAAVREIRRAKGMVLTSGDPDCRSAGSFFKNPVVPPASLTQIAAALQIGPATIPHWPAADGQVKLPAAWLLERAGFPKGFVDGKAGISSRHTLALINRGGATFADIERLQNTILATVAARFGITLEREPVLLGSQP